MHLSISISKDLGRQILEEAVAGGIQRSDASLVFAKYVLAARRRRARFLKGIKFGEPSWDMILDLYVAFREGRRVDVTGLYLSSGVAATTAVRYVEMLEEEGLVHRTPDQSDGRRFFVTLADRLRDMIEQWLENELIALKLTTLLPPRA